MSPTLKKIAGTPAALWLAVSALPILCLLSSEPVVAQTAESLQRALTQAGWTAQRSDDGSLTFRPPTAAEPTPQVKEAASLKARLRARGWRVKEEADGTLILHPPAQPAVTPVDQGPGAPTVTGSQAVSPETLVGESTEGQTEGSVVSVGGLADALRERGWRVQSLEDGALIVRLPEGQEEAVRGSGVDDAGIAGCGHWLAPAVSAGEIRLPVNEWSEAHKIARQWIDQGSNQRLMVGKIRRILRTYLISIVTNQSPYELAHQLVIRSRDGRLVAVF